jgi:pseudaminic acid synthase
MSSDSTAPSIEIQGRRIGAGQPAYIIAEMSANHNQSFEQAVEIIRAAHAAGVDAVKIQTYTADTLTIKSDAPPFQIHGGLWDGRTLHDLYEEAYTPWDWQPRLKKAAEEMGLDFFSSPFDNSAVDFLEEMQVPAYKIASFELVDTMLLRRVAQTGKPVIMSTGLATLAEISEAVSTLREAGARDIALLKCTSAYPAPYDQMNLRTIPHLAAAFDVPAGLSDHTLGVAVPVAAVALGASIIEKHFTLSRAAKGPDSAFSLEPAEMKLLVESVRAAEAALGAVGYTPTEEERANRRFRRSLFVVEDVRAGERFTEKNLRSIRPGHGLSPRYLPQLLGRRAAQDITRGTPLTWDIVLGE